MAMNFAIFTSYSALMTLFPLHAAAVLGEAGTASVVGSLFAAGAVVGFVGAPLGGYLADRLGRKAAVVPAACLVSLGACLMAGYSESYWSMAVAVMIWGTGNSMVTPGLAAFAADLSDDEGSRGQSLSLTRMAADAAFLVAPAGLGLLAQGTSCSTAFLTTAGVIGAANMIFALRTREAQRRL